MKILKNIVLVLTLLLSVLSASTPYAAAATCSDNSGGACGGPSGNLTTPSTPAVSDPNCNDPSPHGLQACIKNNKIVKDLNAIIDFLSAGVAIVVIGSIILGAIQYTMAGDNPDGVKKAKKRITDALLAFLAFLFIFAFLQWIIPGGI
jgi:hypothetical protein